MIKGKIIAGFIGAGGIARSHALALNSLKYYYNDSPAIELAAVCSVTSESRNSFSDQFGFAKALSIEEFLADTTIDTVYILGPNKVHYSHLKETVKMASVKRIYIEKPVCSGSEEEKAIVEIVNNYPHITIQVGFQYLFAPAIREALQFWKSGIAGKPVHFDFKYYHSDYLRREYRDKRQSRLTPAPDGGAMADLGSHAISLATAFLGDNLNIISAVQAGGFEDVPSGSDLFSLISLTDRTTGATGTLAASRVSSGTGDLLSFELYAEKGALRYSTQLPDYFEYFLEDKGEWSRKMSGSNYKPVTSFPSGHVPPGWLRSMIHAHYIFLTGNNIGSFVPDIDHGLKVQRLVTQTAEHLEIYRKLTHRKGE